MIWVAEYENGDLYTSFDLKTKKKNDYYKIKDDKLKRFGFIGRGKRYYFNISDGSFCLNGNKISISLHRNDKNKTLNINTKENGPFNELIQYKDGRAVLGGYGENNITSYNFGYVSNLQFKDFKLYCMIECKVSWNNDVNLSLKMISDKNISGELIIKEGSNIDTREPINLFENSPEIKLIKYKGGDCEND